MIDTESESLGAGTQATVYEVVHTTVYSYSEEVPV